MALDGEPPLDFDLVAWNSAATLTRTLRHGMDGVMTTDEAFEAEGRRDTRRNRLYLLGGFVGGLILFGGFALFAALH